MNAKPVIGVALLALGASACSGACQGGQSPGPSTRVVANLPENPTWRTLRAARLEEGLAAQERQFPELHKLEEKYKTGYAKVQRFMMLDAVGNCVTEERVGSTGDGGKWVCNPYRLPKDCVVYGVGAADEISFEEQMAERHGCDVHVFDPSGTSQRAFGALQSGKALGKGKLTFHPWGLGPVSEKPGKEMDLELEGKKCEVRTLAQIAQALGHKRIDVLKLDIEGGEFAVLKDLRRGALFKKLGIDQLQIEFHAHDMPAFDKLVDEVQALRGDGYMLFRKELNPYGVECCSEYAFAQKDYLLD